VQVIWVPILLLFASVSTRGRPTIGAVPRMGRDRITRLIKDGKTLDQAISAKPTKDFDPRWANGPIRPDQLVEEIYSDLKKDSALAAKLAAKCRGRTRIGCNLGSARGAWYRGTEPPDRALVQR